MSDALRCAAQPLLPEQPRTPRIAMIDNEERKLKVLVQYIVFFLTSILLQAAFLPPLAPFDVGQRITLTFTCSFTRKMIARRSGQPSEQSTCGTEARYLYFCCRS
jgi:hypothetical protein